MAVTLDEVLTVRDGALAVVREHDGAWFLIFHDGRAFILPEQKYADYLLAKCGKLRYGIAGWNGEYWGLNQAPILSEHQVQVIERLTGPVGDEVIAALLEQAENGA